MKRARASAHGTLRTMEGVDASRRVGWAKYYEALEESKEQRAALNQKLVDWVGEAVAMALMVQFHKRLPADDELVAYANDLINSVGSTPFGSRLIEAVKAEVL